MSKGILVFVAVYHAFILQTMSQDVIQLAPFATGFNQAVDIAHAGGDLLYIVERPGRIRIVDSTGTRFDEPFLDIRDRVNSSGGELGLLGLIFHPAYPDSPYCYVNYTRNDQSTVVSRFVTTSATTVDRDSETRILLQSQPFANHNAGDLAFGPDGYLYVGFGDGGAGDDPQQNSQNRQTWLGKMLRIDVDGGDPYAIPEDNPFVMEDETLDEIWALGLRNPWRYSFDRLTGDLYIADVGQSQREEVNLQPFNSTGGENYGWRCYEGSLEYLEGNCPDNEELTDPIFEYAHQVGNCSGSVTGGYVYRGSKFPDLIGWYFMSDYCTGVFRGWNSADSTSEIVYLGDQFAYTTFGEDRHGELYVAGSGGAIFKIESTTSTSTMEASSTPVKAFPVPSSDRVYFQLPDALSTDDIQVMIYNNSGVLVKSQQGLQDGALSTQDLSSGMYFVEIRSTGARFSAKIVVNH